MPRKRKSRTMKDQIDRDIANGMKSAEYRKAFDLAIKSAAVESHHCATATPQIRDPHKPKPHPLADRIDGEGTRWVIKPEHRGGIPRRRREQGK